MAGKKEMAHGHQNNNSKSALQHMQADVFQHICALFENIFAPSPFGCIMMIARLLFLFAFKSESLDSRRFTLIIMRWKSLPSTFHLRR